MRLKWKKVFKYAAYFGVLCALFYLLCYNSVTDKLKRKFQGNNSAVVRSFDRGNVQLSTPKLRKEWTNDRGRLDNNIFKVISTCKEMSFPLDLARQNSWHATSTARTAYVFAAYFIETKNMISVIGIKSEMASNHICQLWFVEEASVRMEEKPAEVLTMSEGHGRRYTAVFYQCAVFTSRTAPTYVSIVTESCNTTQHLLKVQLLKKQYHTERNFTVCLTPLNFRYNRDYEIIEWIELNRILGAEKFIIYNYSSGINVEHVLDYYSKQGVTEVVQWNIPVRVDTWPRENKIVEIHYFGQVAALNDCLYRNKYISEFVVNLDLDEYIIPHGDSLSTWSDMLERLEKNAKVYIFRNTFFKKEWDNAEVNISNKSLVDKLQLVTLQKTQHERKISLPGQRSKYFVRTNYVSHLMIHEVHGVLREDVPIETGLLHHYRNWETENDPPHVKVLDKTVPDKFGQLLIENVQRVWSDLAIGDRK